MSKLVSLKLDGVDGEILDALQKGRADNQPWGRNTPKNLGDELGYSRQHISTRLGMLEAAGLVRNIGGGVYEFIDDPRKKEH
ncbi:Winged helix-turn-helix DNA-binding [Haladaptatus litoreus]|uniref:Winged helix-turn-helix DNA-binding n=1 Tax=Haladaptatus litoreus TaxID=553468 RepID=A0A1N7EIZ3_9EURY|nr:Winged helix-turn-helix DNA-binding [Haladaptatus litoreus]